jgi:membrane fusion protein, multidrug efflux system
MKIYYLPLLWIFMAMIFTGCKPRQQTRENAITAIPVEVQKVTKSAFQREISISGNVEGNRTVRLGFMVAGRINFIAVDEGRKIGKGELLSSLDPESYAIAKELADIQVNQAEEEYNRLKAMHETKSISESDFSKISYGLQQAKAQQKLHAKNLADTRLYSPLTGVLIKKLGETGEITGVGIPQFVVSDISSVKVTGFIPEDELRYIRLGLTASVYISSLDSAYQGKIVEVGSAADPASRAFTVKVSVANPDLQVRPGMIAEIKLPSQAIEDVISVPMEAILHDFNNNNYLFMVDESTGKAFKRSVSLGRLHRDQVEIISGISENDRIVTGGQHKLSDGSLVTYQK